MCEYINGAIIQEDFTMKRLFMTKAIDCGMNCGATITFPA